MASISSGGQPANSIIFATVLALIVILNTQGSRVNGQQNDHRNSDQKQQQTIKVQYVNVNGLPVLVQFTYVGPPKILPIATADSYPEGSSINLICTVSGGQRRGLTLSWTLNGADISENGASKHSDLFDNVAINTDDSDISILKIKNATLKNSGQYTCTAKNPLGQDSTSVKIVINVDMKWSKVPNDQIEVGIGKEVLLECDAIGSPQPIVEWIKHSSDPSDKSNGTHTLSKGNVFKISRAQHKDSGLYECMARNGVNDNLRKFVQVKVRGK